MYVFLHVYARTTVCAELPSFDLCSVLEGWTSWLNVQVQKPPSSIAADHVKHAKEQQTSADIGPLRSADSKTPIQPCDTSLADHTPNTREHLIKSFSGQPGSTDAQPLPAKKTNAKTKPKKTSTQTSAPMTNSSNTSRKAAPAQSINSTPLAAKRTAKGAAQVVTDCCALVQPDLL